MGNHKNLRLLLDKFFLSSIQTVYHGSEMLSYLGPKMWKSIPTESKQKSSLNIFEDSIKLWQLLHPVEAV